MKRSLHVGINRYPGASDLYGCVNDAQGWGTLAAINGYETSSLLDDDATWVNVTEELRRLCRESRWGDRILFTFSGHGTWVPDVDRDEEDGRDEALVLWPGHAGSLLTDDDLRLLWLSRKRGVRVTTFSDSCHSGTVSRFLDGGEAIVRFVHPAQLGIPIDREREGLPTRLVKPPTNTVLFSGCEDREYSYDAHIDGLPQGAFSAVALRVARDNPGISYGRWHKMIRTALPSDDYPQSPQFEGSIWQRTWKL